MFTGIVEAVGTVLSAERKGTGAVIRIATPESFNLQGRVRIGDSIATNGVCLTATALHDRVYSADASVETLSLTTIGTWKNGHSVNLELALTPLSHLGGHIMQGHVDGIGEITALKRSTTSLDVYIRAPRELLPYIALKGSIAVDGASLTVNGLEDDVFRLTLIPHTQAELALDNWLAGAKVNLEVDVLARYLERLIEGKALLRQEPAKTSAAQGSVSLETLLKNGFV